MRIGPPPETEVAEVAEEIAGVTIVDPYRWLEEQESAQTRAWIERQNAYTDSVLEQLPGRDELRQLAERLYKIDTITTPTAKGDRYFFSKRASDQDLSVLYYREKGQQEDLVLIDPHPMSEDKTTSVGYSDISEDGRLVAYTIRKGGVDEVEVRFRDVDKGQDIDDSLPLGRYMTVSLTPDKKGVYFSRYGTEHPGVYYHELGTDASADKKLFGEGYAPHQIIICSLSQDGAWLIVHVLEGSSGPTQIHLKDLQRDTPFQTLIQDGKSRSFAGFAGEQLVITTDLEAPNSRLMIADPGKPGVENWREIIPEQPDAVLQGAAALGGRLFVTHLKDVRPQLASYDLQGNKISDIEFDTIGSIGGGSGNWDSSEAFFTFSSFHLPPTIYRLDIASGEREIWARIQIPVETDSIEVQQVRYGSKDGTQVPMFVIHRRGLRLEGGNPTILTGYGGFNVSLTPGFSTNAAAWVQLGGVYAVANLRGGGEFGEPWHQAGMMEKKQNVFDDFAAAAQYLIDQKYTSSQHLAVMGGSNGGLLVGAILTQRPDLVGAVVCTYPLLDMLRYHKLLVGSFWVSEYGSADHPDQFAYLKAYSPYHNVRDQAHYPATLFMTGDGDTRVAPAHARKMAALVQAKNGSENPILLRYHIKAGHSGGQPVNQQIDEMVDTMSFLRWRLGADH